MQMAQFLESLETDLDRIAAVGDDTVAQAAARLSQAIRGSAGGRRLGGRGGAGGAAAAPPAAARLSRASGGSAGMRLLEALGEAAVEISAQLPEGHVEVRMSGQDPTFVFVEELPQQAAPTPGDDEASARITLRL